MRARRARPDSLTLLIVIGSSSWSQWKYGSPPHVSSALPTAPQSPSDMAKATPTTSRRRVLRLWAFEIVTTVFLLALMVAIGVTLISYNGKPSPNWGPQINLNALLALLSTLLRAALVFLVSQVVSQRKWHYFSDRA